MTGRLRTIRDLAAVVVAITLVGAVVVGAVGSDRATATTTTRHRVTIPAAAFHPVHDGVEYFNEGHSAVSGGFLMAPVPFYRPGDRVKVLNMKLYATDQLIDSDVCAVLHAANPGAEMVRTLGRVCSDGDEALRRVYQVRFPPPRGVSEFEGAYVVLEYGSEAPFTGPGQWVHGVRITYQVTE